MIIGVTIAISDIFTLPEIFYNLSPVYFHLFMIGWINQLIFGVAWWLFPLLPQKNNSSKELYKGNKYFAWSLYISLNLGLFLRAISEPYNIINPNEIFQFLLVISAILQIYSALCFIFLLWPRVYVRKSVK